MRMQIRAGGSWGGRKVGTSPTSRPSQFSFSFQTAKELRAFKRFKLHGDRDEGKLMKQKWEINRAHVSPAIAESGWDESRPTDSRNSAQRQAGEEILEANGKAAALGISVASSQALHRGADVFLEL